MEFKFGFGRGGVVVLDNIDFDVSYLCSNLLENGGN